MTASVWIVTREKGNGRDRAVIGVYRAEPEARDRIAAEEQKDPQLSYDYDVEEWDIIGDPQRLYVVVEDRLDRESISFLEVEDEEGNSVNVRVSVHPKDASLTRFGPFEEAA